jgi:2-octaprenyl-6-methoxyphenol hydroxylase
VIDITIIGAGPVGGAFALTLAYSLRGISTRPSILLIDARAPQSIDSKHPLERTLALSSKSHQLLTRIGLQLPPLGVIESIHVSEQGRFGRTVLRASELGDGEAALGYTIKYSQLLTALDRTLESAQSRGELTLRYSSSIDNIAFEDDAASVSFSASETIRAKLVVAADGGASLRWLPGIQTTAHDYEQTALLARLTVDRPLSGMAYERFTPRGPLALLPLASSSADEHGASMVWVCTKERAQELSTLNDEAFLAAFQQTFGQRAGRFISVTERKSYPLQQRLVQQRVGQRFVVIGNAAQTLHPVAGQGLNLGLRDASALAAHLASLINSGSNDLGAGHGLVEYDRCRSSDSEKTAGFTRLLVDVFERDSPIIAAGRGLALTALDLFPPARKALVQRLVSGE